MKRRTAILFLSTFLIGCENTPTTVPPTATTAAYALSGNAGTQASTREIRMTTSLLNKDGRSINVWHPTDGASATELNGLLQGDGVIFTLINVTARDHAFTVKTFAGNVVIDTVVKANTVIRATLPPVIAGQYNYYCSLHVARPAHRGGAFIVTTP